MLDVSMVVRRWLPLGMFVATVGIVAVRATRPITDPDPWWHLRLGREFRGDWRLSDPGSLSPFAQEPWVPTQWALEVVASLLVDWFGLAAVAWLTGLGVVAVGAILWCAARARADVLPAAVASGTALVGTLSVVAPRPQVASLVLLGVFSWAWRRTTVDVRPRWWLVPLGWVWACTHGFWFVGLLLGVVVVVGLSLDRRIAGRRALALWSVPLAGLVVAALTPVGPRLLLTPFRVQGVSAQLQEWQPPSFQSPLVMIVAVTLAAVVVTWARRGDTSWADLAVLVLAGMLLVYSARTVALAAVLMAPIVAETIQAWVQAVREHAPLRERWVVAVGLGAAAVAVTISTAVRAPYEDPYPVEIDAALAGLPDGTVVFNDYFYGGWLAWRHPELAHGIDGLTEAYGAGYLQDYGDAQRLKPGWQEFLDGMGAEVAFLPPGDSLAVELSTHLSWETLAETPDYVVLRQPN